VNIDSAVSKRIFCTVPGLIEEVTWDH
jgi:hypothetical protein